MLILILDTAPVNANPRDGWPPWTDEHVWEPGPDLDDEYGVTPGVPQSLEQKRTRLPPRFL
jgi:hypothetical protein